MSRRALVVGLVVVGAIAACTPGRDTSGSPGTATGGPGVRLPGSKGIVGLQHLSEPAAVRPLDGSQAAGLPGTYTIAKSCTAARAAYRNPAALPTGARIVPGPRGWLLVRNAFGDDEGITFADRGKRACAYTLADQPTVQITATKPLPAGSYWGTVGCAPLSGDPAKGIEVALITADGKPWIVYGGLENGRGSRASFFVVQATLAQLKAASRSGDNPGARYPVALSDSPDGRIVARLGGAATGQTVTLSCTTNFGQVFGAGFG